MSESKNFDLVVLGGGPGGYTAAFRGADLGLNVCLIEKADRLGGVCLNVGCIPSKTLLHGAVVIEEAGEAADFGITFGKPDIDLETLRAKKESVIKKLTDGLDGLVRARKITRIIGSGVFHDQESVQVTTDEGDSLIGFKNAVIATGSYPFMLPGLPDDPRIWDSSDALRLDFIPERLLVVGGGVIGLEMAQVYHALGSEITIVEMLDQLIPPADKDVVQPLFQKLKQRYTIKTKARVTKLTPGEKSVKAFIEHKEAEESEFDAVLIAVGRKPNSEGIGLDKLGISLSPHGYIEVDEQQRTSVSSIFAIGDVVGDPMLAHKATHQGKVAAEVCAGRNSAFSPLAIPAVAYTNPEVAWMGFTEKEAKEKGIEYEKGKFAWGASGRALSSGAATGASKVLFSKETGRMIGAAICGLNGGELIHEAMVALELGADAEDISRTIHAHPTLSETFAFACEMVDGSITDALPPKKKKQTG